MGLLPNSLHGTGLKGRFANPREVVFEPNSPSVERVNELSLPLSPLLRQHNNFASHRGLVIVAFDLNHAGHFGRKVDAVHVSALQRELFIDILALDVNGMRHALHANEMEPHGLAGLDHDL